MLSLLLSTIALADPTHAVVVAGDGLSSVTSEPGAATWVSVLGDCLAEEAVGQFTVVDRTGPDQDLSQLAAVAADLPRLDPSVVVLGVGTVERAGALTVDEALVRLPQVVTALQGVPVLLLGPPPNAAVDADRITSFNDGLRGLAIAQAGVSFLDVLATWPQQPSVPLVTGGQLTESGHARVGALVCAAVLLQADPHPVAPPPGDHPR